MPGRTGLLPFAFCLSCFMLASAATIGAEPQTFDLKRNAPEATPLHDDANLNDVTFIGGKIGWAAGDRGTLWRTRDGGTTWDFVNTPVDCSLHGICFLTDRVGWIVGGGTTPHTRLGYGVLLFTDDGGETWRQPATGSLPRLHYVRFFDLSRGVAVGDATSEFSTGVLMTEDGGKTWRAMPGNRQAGWRSACFLMPEVGAVAGTQGKAALVGGGRLLQPRLRSLGLRGLRDVEIRRDGAPTAGWSGWLVGDGGLVLCTVNGGVVWQEPAQILPEGTADLFDFRAVDCRGPKAWIAGEPGSVIWHTPDYGKTWVKQHTGQTQPINAIRFVSEDVGFAAGDLGLLLKTVNGGESWQAVRGGGRRLAAFAVVSRPARISANFLVQYGAELGYRCGVLIPSRRDVGPDGHAADDLDLRLHDGVAACGGSAAEFDWRFPIVLPGLERNREKLIADWNRRTEGRLAEVFGGKLVARLRTWRPSIIVIDRVAEDDAAAALLKEAVLSAVEQAADPTRFIQHQQLAGLSPWRVDKVYERLPVGSAGDAHVDPHGYLPRLASSVQSAAAAGASLFDRLPKQTAQREAYRLIVQTDSDSQRTRLNRDFFTGVPLVPGSAARRRLLPFDDRDYEERQKLVKRQRNFQAYAERYLDDARQSAQLIAQLKPITEGMPDAQAALGLAQLADEYRRRSQWDLAEATMIELVERFPDEPVSHLAMRRLFRLWSAFEPAWQRARKVGVTRGQFALDVEAVRSRVDHAADLASGRREPPGGYRQSPRVAARGLERSGSPRDADPLFQSADDAVLGPDPIQLVSDPGRLQIGGGEDWRRGAVRNWLDRAVRMASLLRQKDPELFRTPEMQFSLAALMRQRGSHRLADRFYHRFDGTAEGDPWSEAAAAELWLLHPVDLPPRTMATCKRTAARPVLDGVLSDRCWQEAEEFRLSPAADDANGEYALAMLSYDNEYLYFAASVPRDPDAPDDPPLLAGRTHDADLRDHDRVSLFLDVDRDYATWYSLAVDQRGWTSDACWGDPSWNPKWYVAAQADEHRWRIEAAVPLEELVPVAPVKNTIWAVGLVRIVPAVRVESWTRPATSRPRPETFGLLRFD